jgi:holo-[acyl-carrier protein] synthase
MTSAISSGLRRLSKRFGERFENRVFTETEIALARRRRRTAETYAKRFAAKEACAKALGTGVPRRGVHWKHLGVVNLPTGKPTLALTGGAAKRLEAMMPEGHEAVIHLTITDDHPWAEAQVIIEAIPVSGQ